MRGMNRKTMIFVTIIALWISQNLFGDMRYLDELGIPHHPENYVTDLTGLLSVKENNDLNQILKNYEEKTTNQIFVLIAPTTSGMNHTDLSYHVVEAWKPGKKEKDNGILISLYLKERKIRMDVGYGLEGDLPDTVAKRIIMDDMLPLIEQGRVYGAVEQALSRIIRITHKSEDANVPGWMDSSVHDPVSDMPLLFPLIVLIYLTIVLLYSIYSSRMVDPDVIELAERLKIFPDGRSGKGTSITDVVVNIFGHTTTMAIVIGIILGVYFTGSGDTDRAATQIEYIWYYGISIVILISGILLYGMFIVASWAELDSIRERLHDEKKWNKLKNKYNPFRVDELRNFIRHKFQRFRGWNPGIREIGLLLAILDHIHRKAGVLFPLNPESMKRNFRARLADQQRWDQLRQDYGSNQVDPIFLEYENKHDQFLSGLMDLRTAENEIVKLSDILNYPDNHFHRPMEYTRRFIGQYLEEENHWRRIEGMPGLDRNRIEQHRKMMQIRLEQLERMHSSEETTGEYHKLYLKAKRFKENPRKYFQKEIIRRKVPDAVVSPVTGTTNASSNGNTSYTISTSDNTTYKSFSGSGSFGGGGADGSW